MPVPSYFRPPRKPQSISVITGGMTPDEVRSEIASGSRFIVFQYNISAAAVCLRRNSAIQFIRAGESRFLRGIPYTAISLFLGWWGFPWGFVYTPEVMAGGTDVTDRVLAMLDSIAVPVDEGERPG